jgi:hypothetical protein
MEQGSRFTYKAPEALAGAFLCQRWCRGGQSRFMGRLRYKCQGDRGHALDATIQGFIVGVGYTF